MSLSYGLKDFFIKTSAKLNNVNYENKPKIQKKQYREIKNIHYATKEQPKQQEQNNQEHKKTLIKEIEHQLIKLKQNANLMLLRETIDQKRYEQIIKKINFLKEELKNQKNKL